MYEHGKNGVNSTIFLFYNSYFYYYQLLIGGQIKNVAVTYNSVLEFQMKKKLFRIYNSAYNLRLP